MTTRIIKLHCLLIFTININSDAQFPINPIEANYYSIAAALDTIYPPNGDTIPDSPGMKSMRWRNFWEKRLSPSGNFNTAFSAYTNYNNNFDNQNRISNVVQANWNPLGPSYPTGTSVGGVGRASCIAFHPSNNSIIFIGTWGGGIWKSVDAGNNWFMLNTDYQLPQLGISAIAIDPNNANYIYAGSGTSAKEIGSITVLPLMNLIT